MWLKMANMVLFVSWLACALALPTLRDSIRKPMVVREGEAAMLTCVVRELGSNTLLWKHQGDNKVLTAAENRVTHDDRFNILHDEGGDVWVLGIQNVRPSDAGTYSCEVNSSPVLQSFHTLQVVPISSSKTVTEATEVVKVNHNYTECCQQKNVSSACWGFCNLQNILDDGADLDPDMCDQDFPSIVKCMADGRNHVPCCVDEGVPDICQDICRGEYSIPTDDIRTHISCSAYTEQTLVCIADGIEILPSAPELVVVKSLSETSLEISWSPPTQNGDSVTHYMVNISALPGFDTLPKLTKDTKAGLKLLPFSKTIRVEESGNSTTVENLSPFTMYEITVTSFNAHGSSLPSLKLRSLTAVEETNKTPSRTAPVLPDIKECCTSKGIYHSRCVDKFCDPIRTSEVSLPDLMICAPWASDSFSCLANGIDHSKCCESRGLPPQCVQLCTGNITRVDFQQFRCVQYMDELSNCLLQGYGVLPSAPVALRVSNLNPTFAVLRWDLPKTQSKSIVSYNVRYRATTSSSSSSSSSSDYDGDEADGDQVYRLENTRAVPYILEKLEPDTEYEVYVAAVNDHGVGEPSTRILFQTQADDRLLEESSSGDTYNVTTCCQLVSIDTKCMPLCDYSAKLSQLKSLTQSCSGDFPKLLRCGAGGRNHIDCCRRRGIPDPCLSFCTGHVTQDMVVTSAACLPYMGNVVQCFQEGTDLIPGPIGQLHATSVDNESITLVWEPSAEGPNDHYVVHYMMTEPNVGMTTTFELDHQVEVTETAAIISGLKTNQLYNFFVLAANVHGTSLPSSILTVNVSEKALGNQTKMGVPSAPEEILVSSRSTDYLTVSWQHPKLAHPTDRIRYKFHSRKMHTAAFEMVETPLTSYRLENLTATSQYIMFVTAENDNGESAPSETLLAWTDPAIEPKVDVPTIHPINIVLEGGSMTVLCVAMGSPMPTISLYVSGVLVRVEQTRHMVAVISNVTRFMNQISCHAENGYGPPSQASKRILIGRRPEITAALVTLASLGDDVVLRCQVDAHPVPKLGFSRDANALAQISNSTKYQVKITSGNHVMDSNYVMQLTIRNMENSDSGVYYCNAQNTFGTFSQAIKLQARQKTLVSEMNVAQCCAEKNVSSTCMDACTLFLDIDSVIDRPECINDFHKLMKCAADGSDHRGCCTKWGVPRRCLDWCRGEAVPNKELCALTYTKPIMACFHEGKERVPGPPRDVRIQLEEDNSIIVKWEAPLRNPEKVELYRVFWRAQGAKKSDKNDTTDSSLRIVGLLENVAYELVVKAGNHEGTSKLTEPLSFTLSDKYIISASTRHIHSQVGVVIGVVGAIVLIALAVVGGVWLLRKNNILGKGSMFFDSTTFRGFRSGSDTQQIIANDSLDMTGSTDVTAAPSIQPATWKQENLQASAALPQQQVEATPTPYEELRLSSHGAGFKRLK